MSAPTSSDAPRRSRWFLLLLVLWSVLALRIGVAVVRGESFKDELALPALALFVTSAVLGSRIYAAFIERSEAATSNLAGPHGDRSVSPKEGRNSVNGRS
jgi:hypothetical protein